MRLALITIGLLTLLAWRAQAQAVAPAQATATPAGYLPLIINPVTPSPTATATATATATIGPTATPQLPPPSFVNCGTPPSNPGSAPNYPVRITGINKQAETVTLQNTSTSTVSLTGWTMCSITGGQTHPISGSLAPGASQTFVNGGGPIWNNTTPDPGALYTPDGRLASYWAD